MKMNEVTVPNLQWYGDMPLTLEFPDIWDVKRCRMACERRPAMTEDQIRAALESPVGTKSLSKLAEDADEVVILIDDMTRPTRSQQYVSPILGILHKVGSAEADGCMPNRAAWLACGVVDEAGRVTLPSDPTDCAIGKGDFCASAAAATSGLLDGA